MHWEPRDGGKRDWIWDRNLSFTVVRKKLLGQKACSSTSHPTNTWPKQHKLKSDYEPQQGLSQPQLQDKSDTAAFHLPTVHPLTLTGANTTIKNGGLREKKF